MTQLTKEEIAKQLEAGHAALTVLGQAAANGDERGRYQLYAEDGTEIASLAELAAAVRALA